MNERSDASELQRLARERDLYRHILELDSKREIGELLADALALIVGATGAQHGYLEVRDGEREFWIAHDCSKDEVADIRTAISRGILAEALATGKTLSIVDALLDPRFQHNASVRTNRISAVLCAPVGEDPPLGALYLQGRELPGPFGGDDRALAETFARHLAPRVDRLLEEQVARKESDPTQPYRRALDLARVVGRSSALAAVFKQVSLVAPLDLSVLLTGDTGTGKSQLARVLHDNSPRRARPLVELNCAAIPEALMENELFGHRAGAFSSAQTSAAGKVAAAESGTLFLDEIGELAVGAQAKLLQLLQSKLYYPLGETRPVSADVRLIAATNVDLAAAVKERRFREDLFFRLSVLPIRVPSLAERREDIAELAQALYAEACRRHGLGILPFSPAVAHALTSSEWPGNVRQLGHALEAAAIRAAGDGSARVALQHVFPEAIEPADPNACTRTFQDATRQFQRELLARVLGETDWNVAEAARRLDVSRAHVYGLIKAFALER